MKRKGMTIAILTVFLVVFNVVFFVLGWNQKGDAGAAVWISYGFIHIAYFAVVLTVMLTAHKGKMTELSMPALTISITYLLAELVVSLCFILAFQNSIKGCVIVNVILLGIYLVMFLANAMVDDATTTNLENQKADRVFVKECSANLKAIMDRTTDQSTYKKIEKAYDYIHSSPIKSNSQVMECEIEVVRLIKLLDQYVDEQNEMEIDRTIQSIMRNAGERNKYLMQNI